MGTDIHPAVEVRRKGVWHYHTPKIECPYYYEFDYDRTPGSFKRIYRLDAKGNRIRSGWDSCKFRLPEYFSERNYRHFALLGNVRNGTGFAGVYTHDEIPYIQDARGVPDDISVRAKARLSDEHSAGWVTLTELKGYDYRQTIQEGGVLDETEFQKFCMTGRPPENWSGDTWGKDIVTLTPDAYAALFESPIELLQGRASKRGANYDKTKRYYIQATWRRSLYDQVSDIPKKWIPYLEDLVPKGGSDDDVRVVFDFDS